MDNFLLLSEAVSNSPVESAVKLCRQQISKTSEQCQSSVKNGPNYQQMVSVCTLTRKVFLIQQLLKKLSMFSRYPLYARVSNTYISYYTPELIKTKQKLIKAHQTLMKRKRTIPVAMSSKPSPERYNPKSESGN